MNNNLSLTHYFSLSDYVKEWERNHNENLSQETRVINIGFTFFRPGGPIAEVFQSEVAFSHAHDPKPILASYGAGPCVIACGYEPEKKIGFMAHFSHKGEVAQAGLTILKILRKSLKGVAGRFNLMLHGGIENHPDSKATMHALKNLAQLAQSSSFEISFHVSSIKSLANANAPSESLALDTRSGITTSYDPLRDNPVHYRRLLPTDILWAQNSYQETPQLKVSYPEVYSFSGI